MKISFAAVAAFVLASAFLQTAGYAQAPPPGQPYIQVPIPQIPRFGPPPRGGAELRSGAVGALREA
jgi:hypothetical protein